MRRPLLASMLSVLSMLGCDRSSSSETQPSEEPTASAASAAPTASDSAKDAKRREPIVLAQGLNWPLVLEADADTLYWMNQGKVWGKFQQLGQGSIAKISKSGGEVTTLADRSDMVMALTLTDTHVYWTANDGVYRVPKKGGENQLLHKLDKGVGAPMQIRVSSGIVYVGMTHVKEGGLYVITPTNPKLRPLSTGFFGVHGMVFDDGGFFVCIGPAGKMLGYTPFVGEEKILLKGLGDCTDLAYADGTVFWPEERTGLIRSLPSKGGKAKTLAGGQKEPREIAVHDKWVYWTDRKGGAVRRVRTTGGPIETLADNLELPHGIVVDDDAVYWTSPIGGKLFKLPLTEAGAKATAAPEASPSASASASASATATARAKSEDCKPCATQEDFDRVMKAGSKCCPVIACRSDDDCTKGRVCCKIPDGQLCGDLSRCGEVNRVR